MSADNLDILAYVCRNVDDVIIRLARDELPGSELINWTRRLYLASYQRSRLKHICCTIEPAIQW